MKKSVGDLSVRAAFSCTASPSLALLKYWGKLDSQRNLPATPSLALTLGALSTTTNVEASFAGEDEVTIGGSSQGSDRYAAFFDAVRRALGAEGKFGSDISFKADSRNDFPTAAGLASSSSGFAALALASVRAGEALLRARGDGLSRAASGEEGGLPLSEISALARIGSASAARAVFGGFSLLPAGASSAIPLFGEDHWPELRIVIALVARSEKPVSSREAMERTQASSPYYGSWVRGAAEELAGAVDALARRDLERLGTAARRSYLRMFGAMLGCDPPVMYWLPASLAVIRECEAMRREGICVWETMDAGPQVKILCLETDAPRVAARIGASGVAAEVLQSRVGGAPKLAEDVGSDAALAPAAGAALPARDRP